MKTPNHIKYAYIEKISEIFPHTLFQFTYEKDNEIKWSKKRTFKGTENKFTFLKKNSYFRTNFWNEFSDEIRLDFDYENLDTNISEIRNVINILELNKIFKYETYLTGGKGTHLTFRFDYEKFKGFDRKLVRENLFSVLNIKSEIDKTLFQTIQVIGLEGYNHRKTKKNKKRIKINLTSYKILDENINLNYLNDDFVNILSENLIEKVLTIFNNKKELIQERINIDFSNKNLKKKNFDKNKMLLHLKRFKEIYLEIPDGKKRVLDMVTRYIYLTIQNKEETKYYLSKFLESLNLRINVELRLRYTINSMKSKAIFIYKDILSKEKFYKGWSMTECNEPLIKNK